MRKFLLLLAVMAMPFAVHAQDDANNKFSVSTQMFLDELSGNVTFTEPEEISVQKSTTSVRKTKPRHGKNHGRLIAAPDTIGGRAYISAFIRLDDNTDVSALEALGVEVQCKFKDGLVTANIPVDKINEVAGVSKVKKISVAKLKKPLTNKVREASNVDDVLTNSADAIAEGITSKYDGTGVVLGVIDTGIDFQHIAFKDASGNSRIKRAYVYNGSSAQEYTSISSSSPTTDDSEEDHGTHTSSTAGGSSVIISGSSVTVTDDHANATYGGMAPGADLYLAGINGLSDTYIANAFQKICNYADGVNKPVVVSNSWGASMGPRDGTGDIADICAQYFSDDNPNHICLFAASNDAGSDGFHVSGTASSSSPLGTVIKWNSDYVSYYYGIIADAWARNTSSTLACKLIVINKSSGSVEKTIEVSPSYNGSAVSGLSSYFSGTLYAYRDYVSDGKSEITLYTSSLYPTGSYYLAVQFYPESGSSEVDVWNGGYTVFSDSPSSSGYTWTDGSDDMSVSDEATIPDAISIGAYVSKNSVTDYKNSTHSLTSYYPTVGDIAYFSSYATSDQSPTGLAYPWISAPGATTVAAVNAYDTSGKYSYINGNSTSYGYYRVNTNTTYPYGSMEGTSMATPAAAGIVALWLQAAQEVGKDLTTSDVKEVMKETAITDSYTTTGSNATHFGNGKIDALAGIKYILEANSSPVIKVDSATLTFAGYATQTYTKTVNVTGLNLEGNITVSKSGSSTFTVDKTSIAQTNGSASAELTVTWSPTAAGTQTATITLASSGAESVNISLTGVAEAATPTILTDQSEMTLTAQLDSEVSKTLSVYGRFLTGNVSVTLNDENGVFGVSPTSMTAAAVLEGAAVDVTFASAVEGTYTATLVFASAGAESLTVNLTATASDGGTASDAYLNIAKYATIDDAGWNTTYVNTLYKYTEYESDEVAWLTLPVYGAWSSVYYNEHPQTWIESGLGTSNSYGGVTWSASDILLGSSVYFTGTSGNGRARAIGYNNGTNTTKKAVNFYVTNTTAVKLLGIGRNGVNSTYPAALKVYECTINADGSLSASTTVTKSATSTSTSTSTPFNISCTDLDATKVYKVEASVYRGYIYEIGFQTPITVEKVPTVVTDKAEVTMSIPAGSTATEAVTVTGSNLTGNVTLTLNDESGMFSLDKTTVTQAQAEGGSDNVVNVTFAPTAAGTFNATVTLASEGAESVTITLTGTALQPYIVAEPETVTFETIEANTTTTSTFEVLAENLSGDVTMTLADENGVFTLDSTSITKAEALEGKVVTVTFAPTAQGNYTGTVTISSSCAEPVTVTLSAIATKDYPDYYDLTMGKYGVSTLYLDFPVEIPYDNEDLLGVYYAKEFTNNEVRLVRLSQYIPANTGVVVQGNSGTYRFPKTTATIPDLKYSSFLTGVTESVSVTDYLESIGSSGIIMSLGKGSNGYVGFYHYTGNAIPAYKAFFVYEGDSSAKGFDLVVDDEATGIKSVGINENLDEEWYTIQGLRLSQRPTQRGVYIKNGQKVTVK